MTIVERSDSALWATTTLAASVPACVFEAVAEDGGVASAPLAADTAFGAASALWYPSVMAETLGVSVTPPGAWVDLQPKDFAFIHALTTCSTSGTGWPVPPRRTSGTRGRPT
jgi:hypothetical protein